jgi:hypothetical protein
MKAWLLGATAAVVLAASALSPMARAEGPRPSSENNWPGMTSVESDMQYRGGARQSAPGTAPQYVWQEGYDHGGKWHGHWVLVR